MLQDDDCEVRVLAVKRLQSVVRTPRGADAAHSAGAIRQLLISLADPSLSIRQSAYGALVESLRHHTIREAVSAMCVDMEIPFVREHYIAAMPARKLQVWGGVPISSVEYILGCAMQEAKDLGTRNGPSEARQLEQPRTSLALLMLIALAQVANPQLGCILQQKT
jgi:hypothetical protein